MLRQMIASHETLLANPTDVPFLAGVRSVVAREFVGSGEFLLTSAPRTLERTFAGVRAEMCFQVAAFSIGFPAAQVMTGVGFFGLFTPGSLSWVLATWFLFRARGLRQQTGGGWVLRDGSVFIVAIFVVVFLFVRALFRTPRPIQVFRVRRNRQTRVPFDLDALFFQWRKDFREHQQRARVRRFDSTRWWRLGQDFRHIQQASRCGEGVQRVQSVCGHCTGERVWNAAKNVRWRNKCRAVKSRRVWQFSTHERAIVQKSSALVELASDFLWCSHHVRRRIMQNLPSHLPLWFWRSSCVGFCFRSRETKISFPLQSRRASFLASQSSLMLIHGSWLVAHTSDHAFHVLNLQT